MRGLRRMIGLLSKADGRVLVAARTCSPGPCDDAVAEPMEASSRPAPHVWLESACAATSTVVIVPSESDCLTVSSHELSDTAHTRKYEVKLS